jgi:hypothetical protein
VSWTVWIRPAGGDWTGHSRHEREQDADAAAREVYLRSPKIEVAVEWGCDPPSDGGHPSARAKEPPARKLLPLGRVSVGGERSSLSELLAAIGGR